MSDNKSESLTVELITNCMNELAQEIGVMDAHDPNWAAALEELSLLTQLRRAVKFAGQPVVDLASALFLAAFSSWQ